jgi:hypothetical protein
MRHQRLAPRLWRSFAIDMPQGGPWPTLGHAGYPFGGEGGAAWDDVQALGSNGDCIGGLDGPLRRELADCSEAGRGGDLALCRRSVARTKVPHSS